MHISLGNCPNSSASLTSTLALSALILGLPLLGFLLNGALSLAKVPGEVAGLKNIETAKSQTTPGGID